ncbi:hypothetical protein ACM7Q1_22890 [Paenibacillus illinoisensis]|uniref:hypothetical protein n=1 Tax=Paenibacillus illinoisensis TaxID=59845 RepID=UPI003A4D5C8E
MNSMIIHSQMVLLEEWATRRISIWGTSAVNQLCSAGTNHSYEFELRMTSKIVLVAATNVEVMNIWILI